MPQLLLILSRNRDMDKVPLFPSRLTRVAPDCMGKSRVFKGHELRIVQRCYVTDAKPGIAQRPCKNECFESVLRSYSFAAIAHEFPSFVDIEQIFVGKGILWLDFCIGNNLVLLRSPVVR